MSGRSSASSAHRAIAARLLALVVLGTAALAVWGELTAQGDGELSVVFLNVGQGDAVLITAPNRTQVLIDGGADGARVLRELGAVLPFWDRSIDVVLATHPDADHIGGLPAVFARFSVSHALTSGAESDTDLDEALLGAIAAEGAAHTHARRGGRVVLDEEAGVVLEILYPDRSVADDADTNDASIVARLVYGEREFLFTGDVSRDVEEYLLWLDSDSVEADVLKVGHHGSRTSTSPLFLSWVDPEHAVISAGADNRYGHPHEDVLDALGAEDVVVHQTADGRVRFVSDGLTLTLHQ